MFHPQGPTFFELARQALSSTERGYDLLGPKFDLTPFRTPPLFFEAFKKRLLEEVDVATFNNVLDICCGTGAAMQELAPLCQGCLVGIDRSQGMLRQAAKNLNAIEGRFKLVRGNAFQMPFQSKFDLAVSFGAFGHVRPRQEALFIAEIYRVLATGGRFAFITHRMPSRFSPTYYLARGFNIAMHIRNWLIRPPFIMYYLTFLWPDIESKLVQAGFAVHSKPLFSEPSNRSLFQFVIAEK
ncbi:MAG: class I SAM-dependent methyltransferase [Planctomycetota bacterium]|nr:class I SAM-dependent methyltransferase [Planctomycetota bacterium]